MAVTQSGWRIDITVTEIDPSGLVWSVVFTDSGLGTFTNPFVEYVLGLGPSSPNDMVLAIAELIPANLLGLTVVSYGGDTSPTGTANIIIQQNPFTGNTVVTGHNASPGSIVVSPAGPGTGIG